ncbi:MAG: hypothetical protein KF841_14335 [Phycisphaerae bacterium]|nr:hypothetical protein [Phycisphaerae bacterium]
MKRNKKFEPPPGYKSVPVAVAKEIAEKHDKDIVIIVCFQQEPAIFHGTSYGRSVRDKVLAADMIERCMVAAGAEPETRKMNEDFRFKTEAEWAKEKEQLCDKIKALEIEVSKAKEFMRKL